MYLFVVLYVGLQLQLSHQGKLAMKFYFVSSSLDSLHLRHDSNDLAVRSIDYSIVPLPSSSRDRFLLICVLWVEWQRRQEAKAMNI